MSWTDERVEKLQQMWADGQSAAQIAKALGGVTRNAVIGKVHRLGLSNRGAAPRPAGEEAAPAPAAPEAPVAPEPPVEAAPPPRPAEPLKLVEPAPVEAEAPAAAPSPAPRPAARDPLRREPAPISEDRLALLANVAEIEKNARKVTLMDLNERVCKWPIGDPTDDDFHFCGLPAQPGKPYCSAHVAIAFQPMSSRRDRDRQRARS